MKIRFVSKNNFKIQEVQKILNPLNIEVLPIKHSIEELQTENVEKLVRDKLLKAFRLTGKPVLVEHTGLYIDYLNGFPGGLTQIFWDKLQAEKFSKIFGNTENNAVTAKTIIGFCNSQTIELFEGAIEGKISSEPRGSRDFQWDCIFIPNGHDQTFAEMGEMKNEISMRKLAFEKLTKHLKETY
ncbi:dITP/XTP pyrophosphatase [compost metagenome]